VSLIIITWIWSHFNFFIIQVGQVVATLSPEFPPEEFEKLYSRKKPTADTEIIFMCKIGKRSQKALDMSKALGYKKWVIESNLIQLTYHFVPFVLVWETFWDHGTNGRLKKDLSSRLTTENAFAEFF
jgi:rhodanese-related sulfurtransferase